MGLAMGQEPETTQKPIDYRAEQLKRDLQNALSRDETVKLYLRQGVDPKYLAMRYGIDLDRCERYVAALTKQQEQKHAREKSVRGNSEAPEVGEVPDSY